jgi:calcium-dependent protein kinase
MFGRIIGSGKFGIVRIARPKSDPNMKFAIKSITRNAIKGDIKMLTRELDILIEVDHPNIVKFYEMFVDQDYVHIVMEYCTGGELFERITKKGKIKEKDAAKIVKYVLMAIKHLHEKGICHRDIKPENLLFENTSDSAKIKLIDFGLSKFISESTEGDLQTKVGTPYYVAPEVLKGVYDKRCDLWSIGVITYILLCGYPPFYGSNNKEIFDKIKNCKYEFFAEDW